MIVYISRVWNKEEILKPMKEKWQVTYKDKLTTVRADPKVQEGIENKHFRP
jgi:hypothetical protein